MPFGFRKVSGSQAVPVDTGAITTRFLAALPPDEGAIRAGAGTWRVSDTRKLLGEDDPAFTAMMGVAQTSHGGGLLRFLLPTSEPSLANMNGREGWHSDWPSLPSSVAFASDWRGNLFLFDPGWASNGGRRIARLEIASASYDILDIDFAIFVLPATWEGCWRSLFSTNRLRKAGSALGRISASTARCRSSSAARHQSTIWTSPTSRSPCRSTANFSSTSATCGPVRRSPRLRCPSGLPRVPASRPGAASCALPIPVAHYDEVVSNAALQHQMADGPGRTRRVAAPWGNSWIALRPENCQVRA